MWKRKRELKKRAGGEVEGKEEREAFQKSKKTLRSPVARAGGREMEMMGHIKNCMEEMMGKWDRMKERMEEKMKMIRRSWRE